MTTLTDRYVAATLRSVPAPRREEIATELRASIQDMIEGRTDGGEETAAAEREVLTELGDPAQLAARYADRRLQLIGPRYYLAWERLLKLLLSFIPAMVGLLVGLVAATDGKSVGAAVGAGFATAFEVAVQIAFWVTLVFAVRSGPTPPCTCPTGASTNCRRPRSNGRSHSPTRPRRSASWRSSSPTCRCSTSGRSSPPTVPATCRSSTRRCGVSGCRS